MQLGLPHPIPPRTGAEGLAEAFSPPGLRIGQRSVSAECMWEWKPVSDEGRRGPEADDHAALLSRQQRRPK